ncbi:uncharacterized protein [Drosophila kikkawai]|uniref:Secreted protein n=1 Tax=Drosophila kikkawai TaxID=30033 RepID=A0ABM4GQB3_DROKI
MLVQCSRNSCFAFFRLVGVADHLTATTREWDAIHWVVSSHGSSSWYHWTAKISLLPLIWDWMLRSARFVVVAGHHTTTTREWDASRWVVSSHGERALKDVNPSPVQQSGCAAASNKEVQGL